MAYKLTHLKLMRALNCKKDSFLSGVEWRTIPWNLHPKSLFDSLLDIMSTLPALLARTGRITATRSHTDSLVSRPESALAECQRLAGQLDEWAALAGPRRIPCRPQPDSALDTKSKGLVFRDGITAVSCVYLWTAKLLLHQCTGVLRELMSRPVIEHIIGMDYVCPAMNTFVDTQSVLLSANICSGLDSALANTLQPDLLVGPLAIANKVFAEAVRQQQHTKETSDHILWNEDFVKRLAAKAEHMRGWIEAKPWRDLAHF